MDRLPTELLVEILKDCPDLSTLYSLINTSPRFSAIFDNHTTAIVEAVLKTVHKVVRRPMDMAISIRAGEYENHPWRRDWDKRDRRNYTLQGLPSSLLRKFVHLAHRIHVLAHLCLDQCLQRCRDLGKEVGPPSWAEEQRTIQSFWRLQVFYEVKTAWLQGRFNWEASDLSDFRFESLTLERQYYGGYEEWQKEQVLTAAEFVEEIKAREGISNAESVFSPFRLPDLGDREIVDPSWQCDRLRPTGPRPAFLEVSTAWKYLRQRATPPDAVTEPQRLPLTPYRKFGLFLWDREKLTALGLWPNGVDLGFDQASRYFLLWKRLLTPDEVEYAVAEEQDLWCGI